MIICRPPARAMVCGWTRSTNTSSRRSSSSNHPPGNARSSCPRPGRWSCSTRSSAAGTSTSPPGWLRAQGEGFYTIGSAGHEGNAAVAAALRPTDPALLHYRSGGFFLRAPRQVAGTRAAARRAARPGRGPTSRSPAAGTRSSGTRARGHPADLHHRLAPAAGGRRRLRDRARAASSACRLAWPADAIAVCSFGDASVNHSTAAGAINAAGQIGFRGPAAAAAVRLRGQRHRHQRAHAARLGRAPTGSARAWPTSPPTAATWPTRTPSRSAPPTGAHHRRPAFLHLRTVRFMGHAGTDVEMAYRRPAEIAADLRPRSAARHRAAAGRDRALTPAEVLERYEAIRARGAGGGRRGRRRAAAELGRRGDARRSRRARPTRWPPRPPGWPPPERRTAVFGGTLPEQEGR